MCLDMRFALGSKFTYVYSANCFTAIVFSLATMTLSSTLYPSVFVREDQLVCFFQMVSCRKVEQAAYRVALLTVELVDLDILKNLLTTGYV